MDPESELPAGLSGPPEITDELRERARRAPDAWLYVLDPAVDPDGRVPGWAVRGGFHVDAAGELGEYRANPNYRPSPQALRLPVPGNALEAALQRAATNTGPEESLLDAVLDGELFLFAREPGGTDLYVRDGTVQAFTSEQALPPAWTQWQRRTGREIAAALAGKSLQLNPGGPVSVTIPGADLAARA